MRVLYVEDNPANVFLVKRVAKVGKHEVINYIDGGQALKKFDDIKPDLVLMDIQLAGDIGGLEVVRELRGRGVKVPIIAVTAYAMVGDKERCLEAGCDDYLAKPLPVPRLVEIFQDYSDKLTATTPKDEPPAMISAPAKEAKTDSISNADKKAEPGIPVSTDKKAEPGISASQSAEVSQPGEDAKQEVKAESEVKATSETRDTLEIATANKEAKSSTEAKDSEKSTEAKAEVIAESDQPEEKVVGSLSTEDTEPVKAQTDAGKSKETAE